MEHAKSWVVGIDSIVRRYEMRLLLKLLLLTVSMKLLLLLLLHHGLIRVNHRHLGNNRLSRVVNSVSLYLWIDD